MLRIVLSFSLVFALVSIVAANPSADGLKKGDPLGVFYVTKIAGAADDGVAKGQELCYRCRFGSSPIVMVFARETDGKIPLLAKQLDAAVGAHKAEKLRGLITLMGEDVAGLKETASEVAEKSGVKHLPVVVAKDNVQGPSAYKIGDDAITIVVANQSQVVATHTFAADDKVDIAKVMGEVKKLIQ